MVLMGAVHRTVAADARVGIHQPAVLDSADAALASSMEESIAHYVDVLETRWLEKELGILEETQ